MDQSARGRGMRWLGAGVAVALAAGAIWLARGYRDRSALGQPLRGLVGHVRSELPWYDHAFIRFESYRRLATVAFFRDHALAAHETEATIRRNRSTAVQLLGLMGTNAWPAVPSLLRALDARDLQVCNSAIKALTAMKADRSADFLRLVEPAVSHRRAAEALGLALGVQWHRPLYDDERAIQRFALVCLTHCGAEVHYASAKLVALVNSGADHEARVLAVQALGRLGTHGQEVLPFLKRALQNRNEWGDVSAAAAEALGEVGRHDPEVVPLLREGLSNDAVLVQVESAGALSRLGVPARELTPVLLAGLRDDRANVRLASLQLLAHIGARDNDARAAIRERLLMDDDDAVRASAASALK